MARLLVPHPQSRCQSSRARLTLYLGPARILRDVLIEEAHLLSIQQPGKAKYVFLKSNAEFADIKERVEAHIGQVPTVFLFDSVLTVHVATLALDLVEYGHKVMAGLEVASSRGVGYHMTSLFEQAKEAPYSPKILSQADGTVSVINLWSENGMFRSSGAEDTDSSNASFQDSTWRVRPFFVRVNADQGYL